MLLLHNTGLVLTFLLRWGGDTRLVASSRTRFYLCDHGEVTTMTGDTIWHGTDDDNTLLKKIVGPRMFGERPLDRLD